MPKFMFSERISKESCKRKQPGSKDDGSKSYVQRSRGVGAKSVEDIGCVKC